MAQRKTAQGKDAPMMDCVTGKVVFVDEAAAIRAAGRATWKNRQRGSSEMCCPYVCPHCCQWHVGRGPKK